MENSDTIEFKKSQEKLIEGYQTLEKIYVRISLELLALDKRAQGVFKTILATDGQTLEELASKLPYHINVLSNTIEDMNEMNVLYQEYREDGSVVYKINRHSHFPIVEFLD